MKTGAVPVTFVSVSPVLQDRAWQRVKLNKCCTDARKKECREKQTKQEVTGGQHFAVQGIPIVSLSFRVSLSPRRRERDVCAL